MSEMVRRVALALWKTHAAAVASGHDSGFDDVGLARAAIEAVREPTIEMQNAAHAGEDEVGAWQAMIDEALK